MGLYAESASSWPRFQWMDGAPSPSNITYSHWGMLVPQTIQEPNNFNRKPELCAAANASQAYDSPTAWGWADQHCSLRFPFMCKKLQPGAYVYTSNTTFDTYILNTTGSSFQEAECACNANGGHLVFFDSLQEQVGGRTALWHGSWGRGWEIWQPAARHRTQPKRVQLPCSLLAN